MSQQLVAILPLCGDSHLQSSYLNVIGGKPLYRWTLDEALASGIFTQCIVVTNIEAVKTHVADCYGNRVRVAMRPSQLIAGSRGDADKALAIYARELMVESSAVVCMLQATSPLLTGQDLRAAWQLFVEQGADSLVSVTASPGRFWSDQKTTPQMGTHAENGAFYFATLDILDKEKGLSGNVVASVISKESSQMLEEPGDWEIIGQLLAKRRAFPTDVASRIKAIVVDVDGTLTDGGMYYSADGEMMKKFDTRDAHGLKMLERNGIKIGVITAEDSAVVSARMKKLAFEFYYRGIKNKWPTLVQFCEAASVKPEEVVYIGDDEGDVDVMGRVGFAACPLDAQPMVQNICHYVASKPGGAGAVREICNLIYAAKGYDD